MKLSDLLRKAQSVKQKLEHPYTAAVIVAAGSATRMGGVDKIFAPIAKLPVICRTLAAFNNHPLIDEIVVVTRPDVIERMSRVCVAYEKVHIVVSGGASRTESVQKGLAAVSEGTQLVAVHDGARPLSSRRPLQRPPNSARPPRPSRSRTRSRYLNPAPSTRRPGAKRCSPCRRRRYLTSICCAAHSRTRRSTASP